MYKITVYDFMILNTEDKTEMFMLFDNDENDYIYEGDLYELPEEYKDLIVQSWDIGFSNKANRWVITLNVDLSELR